MRTRCSARCRASAGSGSPPACRSTASAAAAGSAGRWPAGSPPVIRTWTSRPYRAWRFADPYRDPEFVRRPRPRDLRRLLPPALPVRRGRGRPAATAVGAPRPAPGRRRRVRDEGRLGAGGPPSTRAARGGASGAIRRAYGWTRPPWFERVGEEHRAVRERVGLIDLTLVRQDRGRGPGALALLQRVCANDVDRPIGAVVYSQLLDERGGMRRRPDRRPGLADDAFRVRHRRGLRGRRPRLARRQPTGRRARGRRPATTSDERGRASGCGARARADGPRRLHRRSRRRRRAARSGAPSGSGSARPRSSPRGSATPASSAGSSTSARDWATAVWDRAGRRRSWPGSRAVRLPGARGAPAREGLPLLRRPI